MGNLAYEREARAMAVHKAAEATYIDACTVFTGNLVYHLSGEENRLCGFLAAAMVIAANLVILSTTLI